MEEQRSIKLGVFSILPLAVLLLSAETAVRMFSLDEPGIVAGGSGIDADFVQRDVDLGWSLRPNSTGDAGMGELVVVNSLGLRSPEIGSKEPGEIRILSLGESSTFGIGVADDETYSFLLQTILTARIPSRRITVINAGVSAYSSYQSLTYLKRRGLRLKPDLILFYHEVNDYLPSTIRDTRMHEVGVLRTDKELYGSGLTRIDAMLRTYSALYRFVAFTYANYKIERLNQDEIQNPVHRIGLPPELQVRGFIRSIENEDEPDDELNVLALGRRVSDGERLENLTELASICHENRIELIVIHPSYRHSKPHECLLTRFCREHGVRMFEAYPILHPEGIRRKEMFLDWWHPSAYGHRRLAEGLADFIDDPFFSAREDRAGLAHRPIVQGSLQ